MNKNNEDYNNSALKHLLITVDKDDKQNYETHSWLTKIVRIPIMMILNILPKSFANAIFLAFSGLNGDTKTVFGSVTTHKALEVMYTYPTRRKKGETSLSDDFWENFLSNAKAIRNRLILAEKELLKAMKEISWTKNNIKLLSLGSGSARAIFEVIRNKPYFIQIKLIDMSQQAIENSKRLIQDLNLNREKIKIEFHKDYIQNLENHCKSFNPDIIEMVGLLDYFSKNQAIDLMKKIYKVLSPKGRLIICNVVPNLESPFIAKGINWPLIYRKPEKIAELLIKGGFSPENLELKYEPLKIHCLAIAKK